MTGNGQVGLGLLGYVTASPDLLGAIVTLTEQPWTMSAPERRQERGLLHDPEVIAASLLAGLDTPVKARQTGWTAERVLLLARLVPEKAAAPY